MADKEPPPAGDQSADSFTAPPSVSWSPGLVGPLLYLALGLGAIVLAIVDGSPMGMLLLGAAAAVLLFYGGAQLIRRPRIEVVDRELLIRIFTGARVVPLSKVVEVRALASSRLGRRIHLMRIEYLDERGQERLDVFSRADLGADPRDVVDTLVRIGFPG